MSPVGALCGLVLAGGIWCLAAAWRQAHPGLVELVAPYVAAPRSRSRLLLQPTAHSPVTTRLLAPLAKDAHRVLDHLGSTTSSVSRRLELTGATGGTDAFRLEQLVWASVGLGVALVVAVPMAMAQRTEPAAVALLVGAAGLAGALLRDRVLSQQVAKRQQRITAELPTIAELLALAVSAGESPAAALERIVRLTSGELARELRRALADLRAGDGITVALGAMSRRVDLVSLTRFTDGIAVAIDRGSPLAEVLRAQAADARDAAKRELMEAGGKREIAMLAPVVFFILPLTVLFALFPGIALIQGGFR